MSFLPAQARGRWLYLYLILELFGRKAVGFEVRKTDSADYAAQLGRRTAPAEACTSRRRSAMPGGIAHCLIAATHTISRHESVICDAGAVRRATRRRSQPRRSIRGGMRWSRPPWSRANQTHEAEGSQKQRLLRMPGGDLLGIHRRMKMLSMSPGAFQTGSRLTSLASASTAFQTNSASAFA